MCIYNVHCRTIFLTIIKKTANIHLLQLTTFATYKNLSVPCKPAVIDKLDYCPSIIRQLVRRVREFFFIYKLGGATVYVLFTNVLSAQSTPEYTGCLQCPPNDSA